MFLKGCRRGNCKKKNGINADNVILHRNERSPENSCHFAVILSLTSMISADLQSFLLSQDKTDLFGFLVFQKFNWASSSFFPHVIFLVKAIEPRFSVSKDKLSKFRLCIVIQIRQSHTIRSALFHPLLRC